MTGSARGKRVAVWVATVYFVTMAVVLTFPGITPFNTIRPFVFGVPFVFVWYLAWILGALAVFTYLYWTFER